MQTPQNWFVPEMTYSVSGGTLKSVTSNWYTWSPRGPNYEL